ncbi:MAG: glycosyltransferase [Gammaproteobacteria bacterium]|nr:glycosyltransferase [Gammaproteobacteria bacterium]
MIVILTVVMVAALLWWLLLLLPWQAWRCRESLDAEADAQQEDLSGITALIPARNEAATLGTVLTALAAQDRDIKVVVVDDQSEDDTARLACASGLPGLKLVKGQAVPAGWSGKLWALEQGWRHVDTPYLLLLDADIRLAPGTVTALRRAMTRHRAQLVSLLAAPHLENPWERLLMPAFVYFFKLLYPFALSNGRSRRVAAAAGGCVLVQIRALQAIGGFESIRGALIDDCALARRIKAAGYRTWMGLTRSAVSLRRQALASIWTMVARTAFTQLRYSTLLLLLATLVLVLAFWVPAAALAFSGAPRILGLIAIAGMLASYIPTLRYYRLSPAWALALPLIGGLYLLMTWTSAINAWRGTASRWKGRRYGHTAGKPI